MKIEKRIPLGFGQQKLWAEGNAPAEHSTLGIANREQCRVDSSIDQNW